ncbi:MAG: glycerol-3-phosphate 1-O-acyltransferase PlsY [Candidatus Omnitrophica bacterium]|nr:glycerol-3-phosphate 1-O-acyltransferase PlsY [Candidatus Omnitrophota bacterium]
MLTSFLGLGIAYLIGSIPTGYIVAKIGKGIDIRFTGSGNVGSTNVFRTMGLAAGALVFILDVMKGIIPVYFIPKYFFPAPFTDYQMIQNVLVYKLFLAACAIGGHVWPVFLGFKGGKGVATTAGVLAVLAPNVVLAGFITWLLFFVPTRIVSISSIAAGIALPVTALILKQPREIIIFLVIIAILDIYKHRTNIERLLKGHEKSLF